MIAKARIVEHLGEAAVLLRRLVGEGLAGNDRAMVRMSGLQTAVRHAVGPIRPVDDLSIEVRAAGLDPIEFGRGAAAGDLDRASGGVGQARRHIPGRPGRRIHHREWAPVAPADTCGKTNAAGGAAYRRRRRARRPRHASGSRRRIEWPRGETARRHLVRTDREADRRRRPRSAGRGKRTAFDSVSAQQVAAKGDPVILVRPAIAAPHVTGFAAAAGILTTAGGRTAHAALVARQMGKPCVVACQRSQSTRRSARHASAPCRSPKATGSR
jgi:phosphohistidine swiveling domain-containing protein